MPPPNRITKVSPSLARYTRYPGPQFSTYSPIPSNHLIFEVLPNSRRDIATEILAADFEYSIEGGLIGFCGVIYPFVKVIKRPRHNWDYSSIETYFYNSMGLLKFIPSIETGKAKYNRYHANDIFDIINWLDKGRYHYIPDINKNLEILKLFKKHKVAYFAYVQNSRRMVEQITCIPLIGEYKNLQIQIVYVNSA